jgi:hypothetical protein
MNLQEEKILSGVVVGWEWEFYSNKTKEEISKEVGKLVKKKIKVGDMYHSETEVGENIWKCEPDFSGGIRMVELISEPMPYHEAIACLFKVLSWIRDNGWTDEKSAIHANISYDKFKLTNMKDRIESINRLKFVLGFNEDFVYERFPKRKTSIYARSINSIYPVNKFVSADDVTLIHKENYELPSEKYFGINFSKLSKQYLEVRYMGGRGYEKKAHEIKEITDYVAIFTYNTLQNNYYYTPVEIARLKNAMKDFQKVVSSFSDIDQFFLNYPNIRVLVDLKGEREIIKTFWSKIREKLFDLIVRCGMRRGMINYDADVSKYQVKDAILQKAFPIRGMEIFDCKIQTGNILECDLYRCEINNAHILDCNLYNGNKIKKSKIINTPFHTYNEATDCYIDNKKHIINGTVERGIIRSGDIGPTAKVSKETEVIQALLDGKDNKDAPGKQGGPARQGGKDKDMPRTSPGFKFKMPAIEKD